MPIDFLSVQQEQSYGRYQSDPTELQLARYFHLDDVDRTLITAKRAEHNRLGFALQLTTVRFLGTFLANPLEVPALVVKHLARQLECDPAGLPLYLEREATRYEHTMCWLLTPSKLKIQIASLNFPKRFDFWLKISPS